MNHIQLPIRRLSCCIFFPCCSWHAARRKNKTAQQFTTASAKCRWPSVCRLRTFLSTILFLAIPQGLGSNWNSFVFTLTLPFAALSAQSTCALFPSFGELSAYEHFEKKSALVPYVCSGFFLLTQLARTVYIPGCWYYPQCAYRYRYPAYHFNYVSWLRYIRSWWYEAVIWTEVVQSVI